MTVLIYGMDKGKVTEIAKDSDYRFDYINAIKMLDNCQPQFDIAKEREKLLEKKVDKQIADVIKDIEQRKKHSLKSGVTDRLNTWLCDRLVSTPVRRKRYT